IVLAANDSQNCDIELSSIAEILSNNFFDKAKIVEDSINNAAKFNLVLLNSTMQSQKKENHHPFFYTLSENSTKLVLKTIRRWFEGSENSIPQNRLKCKVPEWLAINAEVAIYLRLIVLGSCQKKVDIDVKSAEWIVNTSFIWAQYLASPKNDHTSIEYVLLFNTLELISSLLYTNSLKTNIWTPILSENSWLQKIHRLSLSLFCEECVPKVGEYFMISKIQSLLAAICFQVPEDILFDRTPFEESCLSLYSNNEEVQKTAYSFVKRLTNRFIIQESLKAELTPKSNTEPLDMTLPEPVVDALTHIKLKYENLSNSEILGYLLSWLVLFDHFENATFSLRSAYKTQLQNLDDPLSSLFGTLFKILEVGKKFGSPFDLLPWEFENFYIEAFNLGESPADFAFPLLAAHLYYLALRHLPSLARNWWAECRNRQLTLSVESPILLQREIDSIQQVDHSTVFENMIVKASRTTYEILAAYTIEDAKLELLIKLPSSFPLQQVRVDSGNSGGTGSGTLAGSWPAGSGGRAGVTEAKWRAWLLATGAVIMNQNATIVDALQLFRKNASLHFE
ncbi:hypothetical protein HK096_007710, partial [Nowakowskiella sp. JEL0078]